MFVKSKHPGSVSTKTLMRAVFYSYVAPSNGYLLKLRVRFGHNVRLVLNTEIALKTILKNIPDRHPGMGVVIERSLLKRFGKIIQNLGLHPIVCNGEKELLAQSAGSRVLAVIIPDNYHAMTLRNKNKFEKTSPVKIIYQNRRRPKSVELSHDIYIWETRLLPRTVSGSVVVLYSDALNGVKDALRTANTSKLKLQSTAFIKEIYWASRGFENKYRRVDKSPPKILARMLYDFYK